MTVSWSSMAAARRVAATRLASSRSTRGASPSECDPIRSTRPSGSSSVSRSAHGAGAVGGPQVPGEGPVHGVDALRLRLLLRPPAPPHTRAAGHGTGTYRPLRPGSTCSRPQVRRARAGLRSGCFRLSRRLPEHRSRRRGAGPAAGTFRLAPQATPGRTNRTRSISVALSPPAVASSSRRPFSRSRSAATSANEACGRALAAILSPRGR